MRETGPILLTGATGFVGSHAYGTLCRAGFDVICTSRDPELASQHFPDRTFRRLDLSDPSSIETALTGCRAAIYLVHAMRAGGDYAAAEERAACAFRDAAARAHLKRIVYLGGVTPSSGSPSKHLASRLRTGACLREGPVPTVELRAAMIIGGGSESFRMVRDLGARLPFMVLPAWANSRSEPVGIRDVSHALCASLQLDIDESVVFSIPGPRSLSAKEILLRTAELLGHSRPRTIGVPFVTPRLSAYWIRFITRAHPEVTRELVEGLRADLVSGAPSLWDRIGHEPQGFDQAVLAALEEEDSSLSGASRMFEEALQHTFWKRPKP